MEPEPLRAVVSDRAESSWAEYDGGLVGAGALDEELGEADLADVDELLGDEPAGGPEGVEGRDDDGEPAGRTGAAGCGRKLAVDRGGEFGGADRGGELGLADGEALLVGGLAVAGRAVGAEAEGAFRPGVLGRPDAPPLATARAAALSAALVLTGRVTPGPFAAPVDGRAGAEADERGASGADEPGRADEEPGVDGRLGAEAGGRALVT